MFCNITVGRQANCNTVKLQRISGPVAFGAAPFKNWSKAELQTRRTCNMYYRPMSPQCFNSFECRQESSPVDTCTEGRLWKRTRQQRL